MVNDSLTPVFGSLSDGTRRDILQRLSQGELTISDIAQAYHMSLPAISKHLKILEESQLIVREKKGRQHFIRLAPKAFSDVSKHLHYYESILNNRLDALSTFAQQPPAKAAPAGVTKRSALKQELTMTSILDVTPQKAWDLYTKPDSIRKWWPPKGAQLIACDNDLRPGGTWRFVLGGKSGTAYVFSGRYSVISPGTTLQYSDGVGEVAAGRPESAVTITFEALPDGTTLLTKRSVATPAVHQLYAAWFKVAEEDV
jgi:uncharacterized protein YndB with AHSA1/START domain/DNA-binding transcriptional ArsR family regulator